MPSEDSNQPIHSHSLIRICTVYLKKHWILSNPESQSLDQTRKELGVPKSLDQTHKELVVPKSLDHTHKELGVLVS